MSPSVNAALHSRLVEISRLKACLNLTDTRMEVSRRRILQKHLEPARPLRRCIPADIGKSSVQVNRIKCASLKCNVFPCDECSYGDVNTLFRSTSKSCCTCPGADGSRGKLKKNSNYKDGCMVMQWVVLLTHRKKVGSV